MAFQHSAYNTSHFNDISTSSKALSSIISLPADPFILYTVFTPAPGHGSPDSVSETIELARREILSRNEASTCALLDSLLPSVHISKEGSFMYVFAVTSGDKCSNGLDTLRGLQFDGLIGSPPTSFTPQDLYPCSQACSSLPAACPSCLKQYIPITSRNSDPGSTHTPTQSASFSTGTRDPTCLLPRRPLRRAYSQFVDAVRARLIDDVVLASIRGKSYSNEKKRQVKRLKNGFLLGPPPTATSDWDWGAGWEHKVSARPLVYCHLQIHLSASPAQIVVHPILRSTPFLFFPVAPSASSYHNAPSSSSTPQPVPASTATTSQSQTSPTFASPHPASLPLPQGTPITLLPHGTPAFFLTTYTGPTSALTRQFQNSLKGLGMGDWAGRSANPNNDRDKTGQQNSYPSYVIAWINVENRQGEDKGITVIWPSALCLSFVPVPGFCDYGIGKEGFSDFRRQGLPCLPQLPPQLMPSPPPPSHATPAVPSSDTDTASVPGSIHLPPSTYPPRPSYPSRSPTSDSLRAFRALTISKSKDIRKVAVEVGGYVDAVAKERERERERIKREREGGSPRVVSTSRTALTPASTVTPAASTPVLTAASVPQSDSQSATITPASITPVGSGIIQQQQNFYPSPPSQIATDPLAFPTQTASILDATHIETQAIPAPVAPVTSDPAITPPSFDPFGGIEPWSQPVGDNNHDFSSMAMDMDMDFGFGMNMDSMTSGGDGGGAYDRVNMDYEDAFTDDDFSFFDRPSRSVPVPPAPAPTQTHLEHHGGSGLTPAAVPAPLGMGMSPPLFGDLHGPQQMPTPLNHQHSSPWVPSGLAEGFTPSFVDHGDTVAPDLLPPSPGQTPDSHSAPVTPNVQLMHHDLARSKSSSMYGSGVFDPIPFATSHRVMDGKYAVGKFALPSPPDEEDRTQPFTFSYFPDSPTGWKFKYNAVTDPRIGVVKKLIGVKRKSIGEHGVRDTSKMSPAWIQEHEDWVMNSNAADDEAGKSDVESDEDDMDMDDSETPLASRPSTPPPAYLPLGPTLLHTQFEHSQLLPMSTPLRPPGSAVAPTNITATVPTSVPTPVSPAATLGAASEKSKSLEAAAFTVAQEVVENSVWADAWRANSLASTRPPIEVWQADVSATAQLLEAVPQSTGPLDISSLFRLGSPVDGSLEKLESPKISIGKADTVIQVLPTALRFWEKLGLGPRGGKKDLTAFVLFEDDGEERYDQMEAWLACLSEIYASKHFGTLVPGNCNNCPRAGIVPLRLDSFRKNLVSLVANMPSFDSSLVFFIVTPLSTMTLASALLRQLFSAVKKATKSHPETQILFQFVPDHIVIGSMEDPSATTSNLDHLCYSVYNRTLQPVDRSMSRQLFEHGDRVRNYFQDPAFTLGRPVHNKVKYTKQTPARSLDVVDRHMLLQVGYQISPCGKWILAACIDQRGEAHDLGVWLTQTQSDSGDSGMMYMISKVWDFAVQFARKANVEWRIVFAKLGVMGASELDAWSTHLAVAVPTCHELPMVHISVLSIETDSPWSFIAPQPRGKPPSSKSRTLSSSSKHTSAPIFVDGSAVTYALHRTVRMPLSSAGPCSRDLGFEHSFVPDSSPSTSDPNDHHPPPDDDDSIPILPIRTASLIRVPAETGYAAISMLHIHLLHTFKSPLSTLSMDDKELCADITRNYWDLSVLAGVGWNLGVNPILPFHVAAVEAMQIALARDVDRGDASVDS